MYDKIIMSSHCECGVIFCPSATHCQHCRKPFQIYVRSPRARDQFVPFEMSMICIRLGDIINTGTPVLYDAKTQCYFYTGDLCGVRTSYGYNYTTVSDLLFRVGTRYHKVENVSRERMQNRLDDPNEVLSDLCRKDISPKERQSIVNKYTSIVQQLEEYGRLTPTITRKYHQDVFGCLFRHYEAVTWHHLIPLVKIARTTNLFQISLAEWNRNNVIFDYVEAGNIHWTTLLLPWISLDERNDHGNTLSDCLRACSHPDVYMTVTTYQYSMKRLRHDLSRMVMRLRPGDFQRVFCISQRSKRWKKLMWIVHVLMRYLWIARQRKLDQTERQSCYLKQISSSVVMSPWKTQTIDPAILSDHLHSPHYDPNVWLTILEFMFGKNSRFKGRTR